MFVYKHHVETVEVMLHIIANIGWCTIIVALAIPMVARLIAQR